MDLVEEILRIVFSQTPSASSDLASDLVLWFGMLTGVDKFELTLKFADRNLASSIATFLESQHPNLCALYSGNPSK